MAIEYTWNIAALDCTPDVDLDCDVITTAHWTLSGSDANNSGYIYGTVALNLSMEDEEGQEHGEKFNTLTLEEVLTAVKESLGTEQVTNLEVNVANQIAAKTSPVVTSPSLPWLV
jgi:hypothetical protein